MKTHEEIEVIISIHALLAESDLPVCARLANVVQFLSTLSLRRATGHSPQHPQQAEIFLSTLSLRRAT